MRPGFAWVAALCLLASPVVAAERLVMGPYPAARPWTLATNKVAGLQFLREQIPADQSIDAYRDILTSQSFPAQRGASPSALLQTVFSGAVQACEHVKVNGPKAGTEGGYPVAYAQVYCSRQKGQPFGVIMFFKAISGADALYVVNRDFRVPPTQTAGAASSANGDEAAAAMKAQSQADRYLAASVYLCGPHSSDKRCR